MKNIDLYGLTCFKVKLAVDSIKDEERLKYLVLESDPNPDYYARHNFPPNDEHQHHRHFYLLVKNQINCFQDVILRNTAAIRGLFNDALSIYPGYLTFHNELFKCVRIDTGDIGHLPVLITKLKSLGLKFVKDRKVNPYNSLIHYKKYVEYQKMEEDVYQDKSDPYRFFFRVHKHLEFDEFIEGMQQIKFNCKFHLFDSFLTDMFIRNEMIDFIGLYSKHCDKARFGELKQELTKQFEQ